MWILTIATAVAAPAVVAVSDVVDFDLPGRHARPFIDGEGAWQLGFGRSGSFHSVPLNLAGSVERDAQRTLVPLGIGVDHGFVACPDGGWLHLASSHGATFDDTATATRLNSAYEVLSQRVVVTDSVTLATNDMALVCAEGLAATAFAQRGVKGEGGDEQDWLYVLDDAFFRGEPGPPVDVSESTRVTGNAMLWEPDAQRLLIFGMERDIGLRVAEFDSDLAFVAHHDVATPSVPHVGWWAQGVAPIDDSYLVVHMMGDPTTSWNLDTGDVGLAVLDANFGVVAHHQLTALEAPNGAMRPAITVRDHQAVVTFDVGGAIRMVVVELDRDGDAGADDGGADDGGADGGDSTDGADGGGASDGTAAGGADTGADGEGGADPGTTTPSTCACSTGSAAVVLWVVAVGWRRRID